MGSDLGDGAEAAGLLAGSHHQQVAPLVALVIQRPGEADLARLLPHVEKAAGVDQQAVAERQLLERDGRHHQEAADGGGGLGGKGHQSSICDFEPRALLNRAANPPFTTSAPRRNGINYSLGH